MTGVTKRLLLIAHAPSPNLQRMSAALCAGATQPGIENIETRILAAFDVQPEDVCSTQAVILLTPENLAYMSGALKDFFDRCYYPCLERTQGMPYALCVRAGHDGAGTQRGVETITTGLRWRKTQDPLICRGEWRESFLDDCHALGAYMAAGLDAGIF